MRFANILHEGEPTWAVVDGDELVVPGALALGCRSVSKLAARGVETAVAWGQRVLDDSRSVRVPVGDARLLAPIPRPPKNVMCLGLNYAAHAQESAAAKGDDFQAPEAPVVFTKATSSVVGPHDDITLDPRITEQLDWEVELAVVIGEGGAHIPEQKALDHVFGYTVVNDVSARDRQFRHKQFYLGKSMNGACPMGPWLVTRDAVADPHDLVMECSVNGETKQKGSTGDLIFKIPYIVHVLSTVHPLEPGDVIATGTPDGVGFARKPPEFLAAGDEVVCTVDGIGSIRNRIVGV
ncbi:fumarylacetoacetate hydrolase family protein [Ectothiorhodospiraceae bacterium WFHF3C12]|nr:fumarylacetoacetate hydrolase family protein [Ectothiorhodospiraceae bacterium WFHF3C12]